MINILVANENKEESSNWRNKLNKAGYNVIGECSNLSEMVNTLAHKKVHIAICSANLLKKPPLNIFKKAIDFFPRVKIVVVGSIVTSELLSGMLNVVFKKNFDCDLEKYCSLPVEKSTILIKDDQENTKRQMTLLLNEHFLSFEEAAKLLAKARPKLQPGYVVISILTDSFSQEIFDFASQLALEGKISDALQLSLNEICLILDNSPNLGNCFGIADSLRLLLLKETDATFSIGISRNRYLAGELYVCRKEALRAAGASYLYGQNSVVHINYLDADDIAYTYPMHKEKRLVEQVIDGNRAGAATMLDEIFEVIKKHGNLKQSLINKIALRILVELNIAAVSRAQELEKIQMDSVSLGKLLASKSINQTYDFLKQAIADFAGEMEAITDIRRDVLFMELSRFKAKKEKEEATGDITSSELAQNFQTTVSFLNASIMKNSDKNIFDFFKEPEK